MNRVLFHVNTLANPFVEAWVDALEVTGHRVVIVADVPEHEVDWLPPKYREQVVIERKANWPREVERSLHGQPTSILEWWGLDSLKRSGPIEVWPNSKRVVCVDTFPNASMLLSEIRESISAIRWLRTVDSFIVTSDEMGVLLRNRFGRLISDASVNVVHSPFSLRSHADDEAAAARSSAPRLIFTGRSDYLGSGDRSMAKDDVLPILREFHRQGASVFVQRPAADDAAGRLRTAGLEFYPRVARVGITDGTYANLLSTFDAHLVIYTVANPTLGRRVRTGLSTRFATALCAPTPIVVPAASSFAGRFFDRNGVGFQMQPTRRGLAEPVEAVLERISRNQLEMRNDWRAHHAEWAAEGQADSIRSALAVV